MSFILSIDTAVVSASVCLSEGAEIRAVKKSSETGESAAWLHVAMQQLFQEQGLSMNQIVAVAVSAGPGSYTGLRIGMATAKGLCYALRIPLITINTLHMMAAAAPAELTNLLCPMIDARRMEVFTALYTNGLKELMPAQALILNNNSFTEILETKTITFFGNGSAKFQAIMQHPNAVFKTIEANATHVARLAYEAYKEGKIADLAYSEPFYGKEFYSPARKH